MAQRDRHRTVARPLLSRLAALFLLVGFAVQNFAVQTHIHHALLNDTVHVTHVSNPSQPTPLDPYDPANCPLCQEILHAGVYVTPVVVDLAVVLIAVVEAPAFVLLTRKTQARPHNWQSRAPPSL